MGQICGLSCSLCQYKKRLLFLNHACPSRIQFKRTKNVHSKHSFLPLEIDSEFEIQCLSSAWCIVGPQEIFVEEMKKWMNDSLSERVVLHPALAPEEGRSTGAVMDHIT